MFVSYFLRESPSMAPSENGGDQLHLTLFSRKGAWGKGLGCPRHIPRPKTGMTRLVQAQIGAYTFL